MAGTAFIRKDSHNEEESGEFRSTKRRKINKDTSTAAVNEPKITAEPTRKQPKKSLLENLNPFKRIKASSNTPQRPTASLVDIYYFNAPQERNSVQELGVLEQPTAEPEELRELLEERVVGMSDEDKVEEREYRLEDSQRRDEIRFERRCKLYGEEIAKAYVTPGWNAYVPTIGQEKFLRELGAAGT